MRIGLAGPPGSGKTRLATRLALALDDEHTYGVIDEYVEETEEIFDLALGEDATFYGNLAVALERMRRERSLGDNFVSCGTMIDTATYMACEGFIDEDDPRWRRRHMAALALAGCMVVDLMPTYDFVFYLPGENEQISAFLRKVDEQIPAALNLFEIEHTVLEGTLDEMTANALVRIHEPAASH